jgi:hypothetical protein
MSGMCHGPNRPFQHGWNVPWSKSSISAWLECVMVKIVSFSMSGRLENVMVKIVYFSIAGMCHGKNA